MDIIVKFSPTSEEVILVEPYRNRFFGISIPSGFKTDFGSIPAFAKPLVDGHESNMVEAFLVHDFIYRTSYVRKTRRQADWIMRKLMEKNGVSRWKKNSIYIAVRLFGSKFYKIRG